MGGITGIIAEYNPFHKGHGYQIEKVRELTGDRYVLVIMSGDFVQRGAPAIFDKYARTRMGPSGRRRRSTGAAFLPVLRQCRVFRQRSCRDTGRSGLCGASLFWQ